MRGGGYIEQPEPGTPIAPVGEQIVYSQMMLTQVRSAPTNMGWRSLLVTVVLALLCGGLTSVYYLVNAPSSRDVATVLTESYTLEGDQLYAAGKYSAAVNRYTQAINTQPLYAEAYLKRAAAYKAQGDRTGAEADYKQALALSRDPAAKKLAEEELQNLQSR